MSLVVSIAIIVIQCIIAATLRTLVNSLVSQTLAHALLLEGIAAAELCGCCFELIVVADNYGVSTYAILLFLLTIWWSNQWCEASACPYTHLEDFLEGRTSLNLAFLKTLAELSGGLFVYRFVQILWSLELIDTHAGKAYEDCTADLQVPVLYGAAIEAIATCLCRLGSRALSDLEARYSTVIDSFIGTSLVVAAFNYSGGYFNPVLATSLKFGCQGNTAVEHIIVYWIGAYSGAVAAVFLYQQPFVKRSLTGRRDKYD